MNPMKLYRNLSAVLCLALLAILALWRIYSGYPTAWNRVQAGMTITQAREICGPATYSGGMHPETWESPFLWGRWVLSVGHSAETQGPDALVSTVDVYFDHVLVDSRIRIHSIRPPIADYGFYYKAFGKQWKPAPYEQSKIREGAVDSTLQRANP